MVYRGELIPGMSSHIPYPSGHPGSVRAAAACCVVALAFLVAGCGTTSEGLSEGQGGDPGLQAGSPSDSVPNPGRDAPGPSFAVPRQNVANRGTALGRVCWVAREISLSLADLLSTTFVSGDDRRSAGPDTVAVVQQVKARLREASGMLQSLTGLAPSIQGFAEEMRRSLQGAVELLDELRDDAPLAERKNALDALAARLNLEAYPGVVDFADAARGDPESCPAGA